MPRAKVTGFDNYQFLQLLRRAEKGGARIDPSDTKRWNSYVKDHQINEVAALAIAQQKLEAPVPVIIAEGKDTDGLYFYSDTSEGCFRLVPIDSTQ